MASNLIKGMGNDLIREARRRRGLTQAELADLAGTTQSAVARLESGRTAPSFDDVIRYLRLMGLDLDFMLVERDDADLLDALQRTDPDLDRRHDALVAGVAALHALRDGFAPKAA